MPTVDTASARISYSDTGGSLPAVLLIQGVGIIGEGWRPQVDGLRARYRVLSFDNRGVGASALAADAPSLTIEAMAADAWAVVDAAGVDRVHVVGHSMGGVIAQEVALAAPARVKSLSLICTFASGAQASKLSPSAFLIALRTRLGTRAMRRAAFLEMVLTTSALRAAGGPAAHAALAESLRPLFGRDLADQPPIIMKQLRATARYDARARLSALAAIPTVVISSAEDRIARPVYGRELAAAIPGARYEELPEVAHGVTLTSPAIINDRLAAHFAAAEA